MIRIALVPVLLAACGSPPIRAGTTSSTSASNPAGTTQAAGEPAAPMSTSPADGTPFRVVFGTTTLTGHLFDNATADDLASQLPLTVTFRDLNAVEKTGPLPRKLSVDGMPAGNDAHAGDVGYWAPDGDLVLYYGDVGYFTGIMRIGEIDGDMQAVAQQSGDFRATVELAT